MTNSIGMWRARSPAAALAFILVLAGCGGEDSGDSVPAAGTGTLSAPAAVGKTIFFDGGLSVSGQTACASCHSPSRAFTSGIDIPVGGPNLNLQGLRNAPSLMYQAFTPLFQFRRDGKAAGGFFLDGRAATLAEQAQQPFTTPFEMANADAAEVVQRLLTRPYLQAFKDAFGAAVVNDPPAAMQAIGAALQAYQLEDPAFRLFTSKYDYYLKGQAQLSAQEANGLKLFNDPAKGNCAACHASTPDAGVPALFTDFSYSNLGVPRNWRLSFNRDDTVAPSYLPANGTALGAPNHNYYDLGLCGPQRDDLSGSTLLCGQFKTPTLRNAAIKNAYLHNGLYNTLKTTIAWKVTRDTNASVWYRLADGVTPDIRYNDLPASFAFNVNAGDVPFNAASAPSLTDSEINDVVVFICTLIDGFDPTKPAAYLRPGQCQLATSPY